MATITFKWCETHKDLMPTYRGKCKKCLLEDQKNAQVEVKKTGSDRT